MRFRIGHHISSISLMIFTTWTKWIDVDYYSKYGNLEHDLLPFVMTSSSLTSVACLCQSWPLILPKGFHTPTVDSGIWDTIGQFLSQYFYSDSVISSGPKHFITVSWLFLKKCKRIWWPQPPSSPVVLKLVQVGHLGNLDIPLSIFENLWLRLCLWS